MVKSIKGIPARPHQTRPSNFRPSNFRHNVCINSVDLEGTSRKLVALWLK